MRSDSGRLHTFSKSLQRYEEGKKANTARVVRHRQMIGEEMSYGANELKWLACNSFCRGRQWQGKDGELKSIEDEVEDYLASKNAMSAASTRPITYLKEGGYISFRKDGKSFHIALTVRVRSWRGSLIPFGGG